MKTFYRVIDVFKNIYGRPAMLFYKICHYLPLNKRMIIFESEPDLCDNSWALYQHIKKNHLGYKFVWVVSNTDKFKKNEDGETKFVTRFGKGMHLKTLYYYATAKYSFWTHWTLHHYIPRKGQTVINLWHGIPIKATKVKNHEYYNWLISTEQNTNHLFSKYLGCDMSKILPLGYPRNDLLLHNIGVGTDNPYCKKEGIKKVIIWMPTFRQSINKRLSENLCDTSTGLPLLDSEMELRNLDDYLSMKDVIIIIKIHHLQAEKDLFKKTFNNIIILTDEILAKDNIQLYQIVGKTDALITDYSSILFDYMLTDKPIGFILDDIDKYKKSCGFLIEDPKSVMKGEHIYDISQLYNFIDDIENNIDKYRTERNNLREKIHIADNASACENIVRYFNI